MRLPFFICSLVGCLLMQAQHPVGFFTKSEAASIRNDISKYPLLKKSFNEIRSETDNWLGKTIDVPLPKDPAGGYTHERHKANYNLMFNSGILYNLTGDSRYANLVRELLLKYAALNPGLKKHPQATSSSPGRIFWQALNDANWLVYAGMAYDLVYNSISTSDRSEIETGAFKPIVDYITRDLQKWFDLIHNHGVWACAGVGIVGIATNNKEYVDMALYGTAKDGKSGFIAQMDHLFSPDGYYTEGPYYVRYAILPYYLFANALHHARPELKIFQHRNRILEKALSAGLQQTNLNGSFFPINDALKEKDFTSNELVTAIAIAANVYGVDNAFLPVVKKQDRVLLHKGGSQLAAAIATNRNLSPYYPYRSIEFKDGSRGDEGGLSLLRNGKHDDLTTVIFKYTAHGLSHGHFDKLNINLFDKGNEIITDYGSVRFIGVEQKYGGRYLPENESFASQTIAHNTLVVDESSHFKGQERTAEKFHSNKLYSSLARPAVQVTIAEEKNAYNGVAMQRGIYLLQLPAGRKLLVDIFSVESEQAHQYDLPFHYNGQLIKTSFSYAPHTKQLRTLGEKNGYQFFWNEAEASVKDTLAQFTFLNDRSYYSLSSLVQDSARIFLARTGANDPNFNLRREPSIISRSYGKDKVFVNVIEIHGKFDPIRELSSGAYPSVQSISLLDNSAAMIAAEVVVDGKKLVVIQHKTDFKPGTSRTLAVNGQTYRWTGPVGVFYNGQAL